MRALNLFLVTAMIFGLALAGNANAISFPNPNPAVLGDDLDDPGIFTHGEAVVTLEIFDLAEFVVPPWFAGSIFGFYFKGSDVNDPNNRITIFSPVDISFVPFFPPSQVAATDFSTGVVTDVDNALDGDSSTDPLQSTFSGSGDIGFFLGFPNPATLDPDDPFNPDDPAVFDPDNYLYLFTEPSLNEGIDVAATYPFLASPDNAFLLGFWIEHENNLVPLAFEVAAGIAPVPEPATFLLFGCGLAGQARYRRKFKKS